MKVKTQVMDAAETWDILLYGETSKVNAAKLKALLVDFMTTYITSEENAFKILPSDLFTVSSLLVQKLVTQIRHAFITPDGKNTKPNVGVYSVVQFLKQDVNCYLMLTLTLVCHKGVLDTQVNVYYPELAELILVILKSALSSMLDFMQSSDNLMLLPVYEIYKSNPSQEADEASMGTDKLFFNTPRSFLIYLIEYICVKKEETFNFLNNFRFCLLLLSVYEGLCFKSGLYSLARLSDCVQQLHSVTNLLNDTINHWSRCCLQLRDASSVTAGKTTLFYITATLVRIWLSVPAQFSHITTTNDLKTIVSKPLYSIITACVNLKMNQYDASPAMSQELGIVALEMLYAALSYVDICSQGPTHSLSVVTPIMQSILTDECNGIFLYLVAKLCISSSFTVSKDGEGKSIQLLVAGIIDKLTSIASYIGNERSRCIKPSTVKIKNCSLSDGVDLAESEVMIRHISKLAMSLFGICGDLPDIQISLIRLLSQTVCDPVVIVEMFLPSLPSQLPSFYDNPSILSLYLDLLEKAWFQQSSDVGGDSKWWEILGNYLKLLKCSDHTIVLEVLYHIQCILGHSSVPLKTHLCQYVVGPFLSDQLKLFKDGLASSTEVDPSDKKRYNSLVFLLLKLVAKVVSEVSCLQLLAEAGVVQLLFVLLLSDEFHDSTVKLLQAILLLNIECKTDESLPTVLKTIILQVMHSVLKITVSLSSAATLRKTILLIADTSRPLHTGLLSEVDVDQAHSGIVKYFIKKNLAVNLVKNEFCHDFKICSSLWGIIAGVVVEDAWLLKYARDSSLWDLVKVMAPGLGAFLATIKKLGTNEDLVEQLCETSIVILCQQLQLACCFMSTKESGKTALKMFLKEVQDSLQGSKVADATNGHKLCTELINCSTAFYHPKEDHQPTIASSSTPVNTTHHNVIPTSRKRVCRKRLSKADLTTVMSNRISRSSTTDAKENGYDADIEKEVIIEGAMVYKNGVTTQNGCFLGKITFVTPIFHALSLIHQATVSELSAACACNIEIFLRHLVMVLVSCGENITVCAHKGVLAHLLHSCGAIFSNTSTTTLRCCDLIAEVVYALNKEQLSIQEAKQLVMSFQSSKELLERLPSFLYRLTDTPFRPMSYVKFSYSKPQANIEEANLMTIPSSLNISNFTSNGLSTTIWLSVTKYPFPALVHLVSYPIDEQCFAQVWACCCTGNVLVSLCGHLEWKHLGEDIVGTSSSMATYGSILTPNMWNHLMITTHKISQHRNGIHSYKVTVAVDGEEFPDCILEVTMLLHDKGKVCYMAGGATSEHTEEKSLELLEVSSQQISWKLGTFVVYQGCINSNLARQLYYLGPNCASSDLRTLRLTGIPLEFTRMLSGGSRKDWLFTRTSPVQSAVVLLENPLLAYGGYDSVKASSWQYAEHINAERQKQYICFPQLERVLLPAAAQRCSQMLFQDALVSAIGISGILYMYAKVVEVGCSEECQTSCLQLLLMVMKRLPHVRAEFDEIGGVELIQQVLRTPQAAVGYKIADLLFNWCCDGNTNQILNTDILKYILLDWHIWHKAPGDSWNCVLTKLTSLLSPSCSHHQENLIQFNKADAIIKILLTSKERFTENLPPLPADIVKLFVDLVAFLFSSPPNMDCFRYICDHLLMPDVNDVKFISFTRNDSSFSLLEEAPPAVSQDEPLSSSPYTIVSIDATDGGTQGKAPAVSSATMDGSDEQPLPQDMTTMIEPTLEFDVQPSVDRIPGSSYSSEDRTTFSWVNVTGLVPLREGDVEDVPASLEVGLLAELRKQIILLPDGKVKPAFGKTLNHDCLLTMANNKSVLIRTAVVKVLAEYFKRAPEATKMDFITMKGFDLLGSQLNKFTVSLELVTALISIVLDRNVDQRSFLSGSVSIPDQLTGFQKHAVIPILTCVMNTLSQPMLCHATLSVLLQLFQTVPGMAVFLHEHGLLKVLCQLTVVASDSMKSEDSELILKDVFCFCKLIAYLAASSSQENVLGILESLLVCLKQCREKVEQSKEKSSKSVLYLHLLHCKTLQSTLKLFHENLEPASIPTLPAGDQTTISSSNLSSHFLRVAIAAVDMVVYSGHAYKTEQVGLFISKDLSLPTGIRPNSKATVMDFNLAFIKFLLYYFHGALISDPKKFSSVPSTSILYKYANAHRNSLFEQYARVLGFLCLPVHDISFHCVVLEEFSEMEDSSTLLTTLLNNATLKKRLASRLILTIVNILTALPNLMDSPIYLKLNTLYETIIKTTSTSIRQSTRLTSLLQWQQESDPRKKQKLELAIDEMKNNDQRWRDRHEHDCQAYDERNKKLFNRILDKMETLSQTISNNSNDVSLRVMDRQNRLRHWSLQLIHSATRREREILGAWRKIVLHNTHACALWCKEENRTMCWQLDPTEGPCRERRRLMLVPRNIDSKYILDEEHKTDSKGDSPPLAFIFDNTVYHANAAFSQKADLKDDEKIILVTNCQSISQDNCVEGSFIITNHRFLFHGNKPLDDPSISTLLPWDSERALLSWDHDEVVEVHRRRYSLKDNAMEIFLFNGITMFLSFESTKDRNTIHAEILNLGLVNIVDSGEADGDKVRVLVESWQQGEITNFEYLMELNKLAGRTFNDLMQYPVMPFILADYLSDTLDLSKESVFRKFHLPISIQDSSKVQKYLDTYQYLHEEYKKGQQPTDPNPPSKPYHYGSHYSNSGIVLHFLVRVPPFTQMFLAFQGNSFDIPDRTFHHLATTWKLSSSESTSDVKEVIPEFFYFPEFLANKERFKFGERQSGEGVDHVILPPWSNNDPRLFILKHKQALECEYVSSHLHEWVDLVFGYRQTGKAAVEAVNVFHPATYYEEGFDIDKIEDITQQAALRAMVKTYGQMPRQLFKEPHPARNKMTVFTTFRIRIGSVLKRLTAETVFDKLDNPYIPLYITPCKLKLKMPSQCFIGDAGTRKLEVVAMESVERYPSSLLYLSDSEGLIVVGPNTGFFPVTSGPHSSLLVLWNLWDNAVEVKSFTGEEIKLHHSLLDKITCCEAASNGQLIILAGTMGLVYCWSITNTPQKLRADSLTVLRGHEAAIRCMSVCKPFGFVVTGGDDCMCIIWDTNRISYVHCLKDHEGPVTAVTTSPTLGDIVTVCKQATPINEDDATAAMAAPTGCVLSLWSINGTLVNRMKIESEVTCLTYTTAPEGVYVNVIATGMRDGNVRLWSSWDLTLIREVACPQPSPVKVVSLVFSSCSKELYASYANKTVTCWIKPEDDSEQSPGGYVLVDKPKLLVT